MPITVDCTCRQCGADFTYEKARAAGRLREFCSRKCAERCSYLRQIGHATDTGEITGTCAHCDTEYTYIKTTGKRRIYCSVRCKMNAGAARHAERQKQRVRVCPCGSSTDISKSGKPVCRECRKEDRNRTESNRRRRLALYGLTQDRFDLMLTEQRGKCAICACTDPGKKGWYIDHDHECCPGIGSCGNCVRGILCPDCNFLLGNAKDSQQTLLQAAKYLAANSQFKLKLVVSRHDA